MQERCSPHEAEFTICHELKKETHTVPSSVSVGTWCETMCSIGDNIVFTLENTSLISACLNPLGYLSAEPPCRGLLRRQREGDEYEDSRSLVKAWPKLRKSVIIARDETRKWRREVNGVLLKVVVM
jgi:hypothetical protein